MPEQRSLLPSESQKNLPLEPHLRASEGGKIQLCCTFMRGREEVFLPSTIPFTNSSVLFIPHGGLPRFTAGLLTLCNSRQPSTATGRRDSEPEQLLWLLAFLCCFPKVAESNRTHSDRGFLRRKNHGCLLNNCCLSWLCDAAYHKETTRRLECLCLT